MTRDQWTAAGIALGRMERAVGWWIGDWWVYGERRYGDLKALVEAPNWTGPGYQTCRNAASVSRAYEMSRRRDNLTFTHHAELAALPRERADELLDQASHQVETEGKTPPTRDFRQVVKRERRDRREVDLAEATRAAGEKLGTKLYGVIYADPPWRFEPYSRETGLDRAADNHYPTMGVDDLMAMTVPAATNCALFMWATAPMLPQALIVMAAWGFDYRSHMVWVKPGIGTGYWFRNAHELLLLGIKGKIPTPVDHVSSVISAPRGAHSVKPEEFAAIIENMFPHLPRLEMFARAPREGWDVHGNQVE
jgi:N6-adenosine-specific RNA methylase IME4